MEATGQPPATGDTLQPTTHPATTVLVTGHTPHTPAPTIHTATAHGDTPAHHTRGIIAPTTHHTLGPGMAAMAHTGGELDRKFQISDLLVAYYEWPYIENTEYADKFRL